MSISNSLRNVSESVLNYDTIIDNHNLKIEPEENGLKIIFKNFNNPFGSGTAKPILIGQIAEAKLYFMCWSYLLGQHKNTRKIEYTIFKERV